VKRVLDLPVAERHGYAKRLGNVRSRARPVGWGIDDELNNMWYEAASTNIRVLRADDVSV
jgi:hypothetical protein